MAEDKTESTRNTYQIKLQGHLDKKWAEWFYDMAIIHESDGTTTLHGPLPDQAVLHSVLDRIRDMNLTLIHVSKLNDANLDEVDAQDETPANSEGGANACPEQSRRAG